MEECCLVRHTKSSPATSPSVVPLLNPFPRRSVASSEVPSRRPPHQHWSCLLLIYSRRRVLLCSKSHLAEHLELLRLASAPHMCQQLNPHVGVPPAILFLLFISFVFFYVPPTIAKNLDNPIFLFRLFNFKSVQCLCAAPTRSPFSVLFLLSICKLLARSPTSLLTFK